MLKVYILILCLTICVKANSNLNYTACRTTEGTLCVPFFLCNHYVLEDGSKFIDIWEEPECEHYYEVCCKPENFVVSDLFVLKIFDSNKLIPARNYND